MRERWHFLRSAAHSLVSVLLHSVLNGVADFE
jgi:hypothetical protein